MALMARQKQVVMPGSKVKVAVARILKEEGFIRDFEVTKDVPQPQLRIVLKYDRDRKSVVTGLKRISRPGRRVYVEAQRDPVGAERPGCRRPEHAARDHDRPEGAPAGAGRRSSVLRLVGGNSVAYW